MLAQLLLFSAKEMAQGPVFTLNKYVTGRLCESHWQKIGISKGDVPLVVLLTLSAKCCVLVSGQYRLMPFHSLTERKNKERIVWPVHADSCESSNFDLLSTQTKLASIPLSQTMVLSPFHNGVPCFALTPTCHCSVVIGLAGSRLLGVS